MQLEQASLSSGMLLVTQLARCAKGGNCPVVMSLSEAGTVEERAFAPAFPLSQVRHRLAKYVGELSAKLECSHSLVTTLRW